MKKILAIGGAVIKTAREELRQVIEAEKIEILIHNGGSIFHDFQLATEDLPSHSHPIDELTEDYSCNRPASRMVWDWVYGSRAPKDSLTDLCLHKGIDVFLFTGHACDYWQMFGDPHDWSKLGEEAYFSFKSLIRRFRKPFHYICMGSAVIHPEVFVKVLSEAKSTGFTADVVDFKDMYRPRTRVAKFGTYYKMTHKEFLTRWLTTK